MFYTPISMRYPLLLLSITVVLLSSGFLPISEALNCYKCNTAPGSKIPFQCDDRHNGLYIPCEGKHSVCAIRQYEDHNTGFTSIQKYCLFEPVEGKAPPGKCIIDKTQKGEKLTDCFCLGYDGCNEHNIGGIGVRARHHARNGTSLASKLKVPFSSERIFKMFYIPISIRHSLLLFPITAVLLFSGFLPISEALNCFKCNTAPGSKIPFQCDDKHTGLNIPCEGKHSVCAIRQYEDHDTGFTSIQKYCLFEPVEGKAPPGKCIIDKTQKGEKLTDCFCLELDGCNEYNIGGIGARSSHHALFGAASLASKLRVSFSSERMFILFFIAFTLCNVSIF
ncbi:unnamed protein product [Orchesella dallaii]|uniref:Protein quiver n=1 Tax=Orchesella dallaii TaxID=48710 RepID=A0ABP1S9G7_9HEXA